MAIKKIEFTNLSATSMTYTALGGIRFYDRNGIMIQSGNIISNNEMSGETDNFKATATSTFISPGNTLYYVIHAFDTNRMQTAGINDGVNKTAYWLTIYDNQTLTLEFKVKVNNISKIEFVPIPDSSYSSRGIDSNFVISVYDENNNLIKSYNVTPITTRNTIQTLYTPELKLNLNKILILSNDNKVKSLEYINNNTPIMTSNTSPYGEVKASSSYSYESPPYKAFDGNIGVGRTFGWASNGTMNHWISYSYPYPVDISKYAIWSDKSYYMPKEFRFEVSNDEVNWTVVDQRIMTLNDWKSGDWFYFYLDKSVKAKSFRLYCINNNGGRGEIRIPEMKLIGESSHLIELPSISEQNFINYGMESPVKFEKVFTNKNYILQDGVSKNENGYWTTKLDRKPLSIKFE